MERMKERRKALMRREVKFESKLEKPCIKRCGWLFEICLAQTVDKSNLNRSPVYLVND